MAHKRIKSKNKTKLFLTVAVCSFLSACASTPQSGYNDTEINDPLESVNRATFAVNDVMDQALLEPIAKSYRAVTPKPARTGLRNFLRNLRSPVNIANQLLQGDLDGVGNDVTRFTVNSIIGVGGLFDVAGYEGYEYEHEDFGQTLAKWGVDSGPYLVLPLIGPSSFRDAAGMAVDSYADPLRLYLFNIEEEEWHYARIGATILDKREEYIDLLDDLQKNSFDYYAAMRSVYAQHRKAEIHDEDPDAMEAAAIPDYDNDDDFYE